MGLQTLVLTLTWSQQDSFSVPAPSATGKKGRRAEESLLLDPTNG